MEIRPVGQFPTGGESLLQVRSRVWQTVSQLAAIASGTHQPFVLVTHFFPLMALFEILVPGESIRCDNASVSRFEQRDAEWTPTHVNEIRHLSRVSPTPVRYV